uniref:probable isoprenylcysteine alpha-carbonyl methylesterase ICMEL2 isoform X2 n=1 Tax=Erigeron canadensis TaxID=72917 RepID=UPI001CB98215|nr:probable isoprenylcysteine alpha-carbonyl methylesterase ICMEL2 isoform X2 [Erigeron canadensis]
MVIQPQSPIAYFPVKSSSPIKQEEMNKDNNSEIDYSPSSPSSSLRRRTGGSRTATERRRSNVRMEKSSSFISRSSREIGHAASETFLLTRLAFILLRYLGLAVDVKGSCPGSVCNVTTTWFSPSFISIYLFNPNSERLDLYLPKNIDSPKPVMIFVTGGAWIIGYRGWGSLLGFQLAERDIIVTCLDYRNFPQGTISDMAEDVSQGISFVCDNIADYGGDPNRIYLMGQSAGAHIASCALLKQAIKESNGEATSWKLSQIKAYFGLSGGYNLTNLVDHFDRRGLYRSIFLSVMEGEESLQQFSPELLIEDSSARNAVPLLPHIVLFHGTEDVSLPPDASIKFVDALKRVGARAELKLYDGKTHTDLFVQDALRGGREELYEYIVGYLHAGDMEALANDAAAPPRKRLCPEPLIKLASIVSPF